MVFPTCKAKTSKNGGKILPKEFIKQISIIKFMRKTKGKKIDVLDELNQTKN